MRDSGAIAAVTLWGRAEESRTLSTAGQATDDRDFRESAVALRGLTGHASHDRDFRNLLWRFGTSFLRSH